MRKFRSAIFAVFGAMLMLVCAPVSAEALSVQTTAVVPKADVPQPNFSAITTTNHASASASESRMRPNNDGFLSGSAVGDPDYNSPSYSVISLKVDPLTHAGAGSPTFLVGLDPDDGEDESGDGDGITDRLTFRDPGDESDGQEPEEKAAA